MARRPNLRRNPRKRYVPDKAFPPQLANVTVTGVGVGTPATTANVTFSGPVLLNGAGIPSSWRFNNLAPTALAGHGPSRVTLTVGGTLTAAQSFSITPFDPAIRTPAGGYVVGTAGSL